MGYSTESLATCLAVLTDRRIAIGTAAGTIEILNEASSVWETLDGHGDAVTALCPLSRNGLASVAADGAMFVWNLTSGEIVDALDSFQAEAVIKTEENRIVYWKDGLKEWIFG
jgi:WD40 repeat protein